MCAKSVGKVQKPLFFNAIRKTQVVGWPLGWCVLKTQQKISTLYPQPKEKTGGDKIVWEFWFVLQFGNNL